MTDSTPGAHQPSPPIPEWHVFQYQQVIKAIAAHGDRASFCYYVQGNLHGRFSGPLRVERSSNGLFRHVPFTRDDGTSVVILPPSVYEVRDIGPVREVVRARRISDTATFFLAERIPSDVHERLIKNHHVALFDIKFQRLKSGAPASGVSQHADTPRRTL